MNCSYKVSRSCFRYVVPFSFCEKFEDACGAVERQEISVYKRDKETKAKKWVGKRRLWERKLAFSEKTESDIYDYVKNEFLFDNPEEPLAKEKPGCEWLFWRSDEAKTGDGGKILELKYFADSLVQENGQLSEGWDFRIENLGLILFRNNLGFLWYEIALPQKPVDADLLVSFQHRFRELNRDTYFWEKCVNEPEYGIVTGGKGEHKKYIAPFLMGKWIARKLDFLDVHFFAERESAYTNVVVNAMKQAKRASVEQKNIPEEDDEKEKDTGKQKVTGAPGKVPDKALLFTYCVFQKQEGAQEADGEKESLAYHITNGYKESYHLSAEVAAEMKRPFADVIWYATQEGVSYLAWPGEDNEKFFEGNLLSKIKADYFTLYLKVLYQSYSLLIYAQKIQKEIAAEAGKYLEQPLDGSVSRLLGEINLFLTKSMATSVSNIHHQSEFYVYMKKQLRVHEDVKSVTSGLDALDVFREKQAEKAEKKRDEKIQAGVGLFSVLAIGSALTDTYDFVAKFAPDAEGGWMELLKCTPVLVAEAIITIITVVIGIYACSFAWKAFRESRKEDEGDR